MKTFVRSLIGVAALSPIFMADSANAVPTDGQRLAAQCAQCHETNGNGGFLKLAGRNASSLYKQLLTMKARSTPQSIMDMQARGYTDEQLWLISEYFSSQKKSSAR